MQIARRLGLGRRDLARWSVRYRSVFPHRGLREHQRVPLWHTDVPFILITSQKAGSTFGVAWFFRHAGLLGEASAYHPFVHHWEQEVYLKRPGYFRGLERALKERPVFKLVRDPAERAYSSYLALQVHEALRPEDHRYAIRQRIAADAGLAGPEARMPFAAFLAWVAGADHRRLDGHEARQANAYEDGLPGGLPEPIHLERSQETFAAIEDRFGLPRTSATAFDELGASPHHAVKTADPESFRRVLYEGTALPRSGKVPALDRAALATDREVLDNLLRAFGLDYTRYGYPAPKP